jgi:hypothetical protein
MLHPVSRDTAGTTLETAGWLALMGLWAYVAATYLGLPDTIPTHFDGAGRPDAYGAKATLLALPLLASGLFAGLTLLTRYPHQLNLPGGGADPRAARRWLGVLRLLVVLVLGLVTVYTVRTATGQAPGFGFGVWLALMGLSAAPMIHLLRRG